MVGVLPVDAAVAIFVIGGREVLRQAGRVTGTHALAPPSGPPCSADREQEARWVHRTIVRPGTSEPRRDVSGVGRATTVPARPPDRDPERVAQQRRRASGRGRRRIAGRRRTGRRSDAGDRAAPAGRPSPPAGSILPTARRRARGIGKECVLSGGQGELGDVPVRLAVREAAGHRGSLVHRLSLIETGAHATSGSGPLRRPRPDSSEGEEHDHSPRDPAARRVPSRLPRHRGIGFDAGRWDRIGIVACLMTDGGGLPIGAPGIA